jgi:AhpD family alkylhydroperoxidase
MEQRFNMGKVLPAAYEAMEAPDNFIDNSSIDKLDWEYIKIRASQINGCSYCTDAHSHDALKLGAPLQKVLLISAWREASNIFTEEEKVLLQMTEEITLIHQHGLSDEMYAKAVELFGQVKTAEIIMAVATINAWNRIGVATELRPVIRRKQPAICN